MPDDHKAPIDEALLERLERQAALLEGYAADFAMLGMGAAKHDRATEAADLRAAVAAIRTLPVSKDRVRVLPGMEVYYVIHPCDFAVFRKVAQMNDVEACYYHRDNAEKELGGRSILCVLAGDGR